jgi:hypothetical protein
MLQTRKALAPRDKVRSAVANGNLALVGVAQQEKSLALLHAIDKIVVRARW